MSWNVWCWLSTEPESTWNFQVSSHLSDRKMSWLGSWSSEVLTLTWITSHLLWSLTIFNQKANLSGPKLFLEPCSTSMQLLFALWVSTASRCFNPYVLSQQNYAAPNSSGLSSFSRCEQPWIGVYHIYIYTNILLLTKPTSCGEPQTWKVADHQNGQSLVARTYIPIPKSGIPIDNVYQVYPI